MVAATANARSAWPVFKLCAQFAQDYATREQSDLATLNLRIPSELKRRFFAAFSDENKSAVIAELIEKAIAERERKRRSEAAIERILARRSRTRPVSTAEIRKILAESRKV